MHGCGDACRLQELLETFRITLRPSSIPSVVSSEDPEPVDNHSAEQPQDQTKICDDRDSNRCGDDEGKSCSESNVEVESMP